MARQPVLRLAGLLAAWACVAGLTGCASSPSQPSASASQAARPSGGAASSRPLTAPGSRAHPPLIGGKYYLDDGPGTDIPDDLDQIPDAVPRLEPFARGANRPYTVMARTYTPIPVTAPYRARGEASWYGRKYHGKRTATGEVYDMYTMTAAHPTLPLPSYARVTNLANGKQVVVRVNDRGPFLSDRIMDLSYAAAYRLGYVQQGRGMVEVERIMPEEIARWAVKTPPPFAAASVAIAVPTTPQPNPSPTTVAITPPPTPAATQTVASVAGTVALVAPVLPTGVSPSAESAPNAADEADPIEALLQSSQSATALIPAEQLKGAFVQLGAFSSMESALRFRDQIGREVDGTDATLQVTRMAELYKVLLGPYPDRNAASADFDKVRHAAGLKPLIVTR